MSHFSNPYNGAPPVLSGIQLTQPERLSFRSSIVPTSRFTLSPRHRTNPRFNSAPAPSHIAILDNNPSLGSATSLAVLEGRRLRTNDSFSTAGSSIYSTTHDEKPPSNNVSPHGEFPKIAIKRGLGSNWSLIAPHILVIAVTTAVCQLSFRNAFWMDLLSPESKVLPGLSQGGVLNLLQVVAKVHELTILASISTIMLHVFQASLAGPDGIPLGLMANVFDLSTGSFLRQKSFWASIVSSGDSKGSRLRFTHLWALSLFGTIMVMISGPSSAIAILPTLNFFDLPKPFNQTIRPLYIFNHSTELWPIQLTGASLNGPGGNNCSELAGNTIAQDICPAGGFREIYSWVGSGLIANVDEARNISFQDESSNTRRVVTVQSCNATLDGSGRASGMGINGFLHRALTTYWVFAQQNFHGTALTAAQPQMNVDSSVTKLYAPRVEVLCKTFDSGELAPTFPTFDHSIVPVPGFPSNKPFSLTSSNFTIINIPSSNLLQPTSFLGTLQTHPIITFLPNTQTAVQTIEHVACSIYTFWHPIIASYSPTISDQVSYQPLTPLEDTCLKMSSSQSSQTTQRAIKTTITPGFASAINQKINFGAAVPVFSAIFDRFISNDSSSLPGASYFPTPRLSALDSLAENRSKRARMIASFIAGIVTDSLARIAGNGVFPYTSPIFLLPNRTETGELQGRYMYTNKVGGKDLSLNTTEFEDVKEWVRVKVQWKRYGYGYSFSTGETVRLGVCVLVLHGLFAGAYVVWVVWIVGWKGRGVERGWEGVLEFMALGLSTAGSVDGGRERLLNTCAGVETTGVWRERIAVRESEDGGGGLEVVVGEGEVERSRGRRIRPGVAYGAI